MATNPDEGGFGAAWPLRLSVRRSSVAQPAAPILPHNAQESTDGDSLPASEIARIHDTRKLPIEYGNKLARTQASYPNVTESPPAEFGSDPPAEITGRVRTPGTYRGALETP